MHRAFNCFSGLFDFGRQRSQPDNVHDHPWSNHNDDLDAQARARDTIKPEPDVPAEGSLEKKAFIGELVVPPTAAAASPACPPNPSSPLPQALLPTPTGAAARSGGHTEEVGGASVDAKPPAKPAAVRAGEVDLAALPPATAAPKEDPLAAVAVVKQDTVAAAAEPAEAKPAALAAKDGSKGGKKARKGKKAARGKENEDLASVKSAAVLAAEARSAANAAKKARKAA